MVLTHLHRILDINIQREVSESLFENVQGFPEGTTAGTVLAMFARVLDVGVFWKPHDTTAVDVILTKLTLHE